MADNDKNKMVVPKIKRFNQRTKGHKMNKDWRDNFYEEFYKKDDGLFDRNGNNVSRQMENFISTALSKQKSEFIELLEGAKLKKKPKWWEEWNAAVSEINKRLDKIRKEIE